MKKAMLAVLLLAAGSASMAQKVPSVPVLQWEGWSGMVPRNAVSSGQDNDQHVPLFVCRGVYGGGTHPGKLLNGHCNIGWGGKEIVLDRFAVLVHNAPVGNGWYWDPTPGNGSFANAFIGGGERGRQLGVCEADYWTHNPRTYHGRHPGKLMPDTGRCNFGFGGREIESTDFRVLRTGWR